MTPPGGTGRARRQRQGKRRDGQGPKVAKVAKVTKRPKVFTGNRHLHAFVSGCPGCSEFRFHGKPADHLTSLKRKRSR